MLGLGGVAITSKISAPGNSFPRKSDFTIPSGLTYLNSAYTHPMPSAARAAMDQYALRRSRPGDIDAPGNGAMVRQVKEEFARLINASPSEISFIPNTSTGENLVVNGLGIAESGGNVVTDALHFEGSLINLKTLQRERGLDLRVAMPREGRIHIEDLERLVDRKTRLIEISLVAMYNGFQHDLKTICDMAHSAGAYVYADIVQAAGATPIDVRATGVDFCACSSFKWLMGDFGAGFLYAKEELLPRLRRSQRGYHSVTSMATHFLPFDTPGDDIYTWEFGKDASSHFEVGSYSYAPMAALSVSLPYLRKLGVDKIEAHRQPLLARLRSEMPRLGFEPITPLGTKSALITFLVKERQAVYEKLKRANINVRLGDHFLRVSPSVFNDMNDVDKLLAALS